MAHSPQSDMADSPIRLDGGDRMATPYERLLALKARYIPTPDEQQQFGDDDLKKMMDPNLYEATKEGDVEKFIDALEKVSESRELSLSLIFDQLTPSGNSLLHVAATFESKNVIELILYYYLYPVTRTNSLEDTPLHVAAQDGRLNATETLNRQGRGSGIIYEKNKDGKSPLYLAAETGNMEILGLLLEASARDEDYAVKIQGMSPLLAAIQTKNKGMMKNIVNRLPKLLHVRDEHGGTALHSAASSGDDWAVDLLLESCPDLALALQKDKNGSYPIHIACETECSHDHIIIIGKLMLHTWPNLAEIKNNKGQNILHAAAKGGNDKAVQHILKECGAHTHGIEKLVNSKDVDGNTPLHLASMHSHWQVLRSLTMNEFIKLELLNNDKSTALDVAAEPQSLSPEDPALRSLEILMLAGVGRSKVRDVQQSPRGQISGEIKPSGAEWISNQTNAKLVVATLVASVTFTAGFTLPGGYNASSGTAIMVHETWFRFFIILDAFAMYSSILVVAVLLLDQRHDFRALAQAHQAAQSLLFVACTCMALAFLAAIVVAVDNPTWLRTLVKCIAGIYSFCVALFLVLNPAVISGQMSSEPFVGYTTYMSLIAVISAHLSSSSAPRGFTAYTSRFFGRKSRCDPSAYTGA